MKSIQNFKRGLAALPVALLSAPVLAADLDASQLTAGIEKAGPIIVAVAGAIFTLVGILVAIRYAKRAAN